MFERYTENARKAIFFAWEEASRFGSSSIESEHLLLGITRSSELELREILKLKDLESTLRAELAATAQLATTSKRDLPLSNPSKRILAYAAEEAMRLNSPAIGCGHLLLGILRESDGIASRFLLAQNVDPLKARQVVAMLSRSHVGDPGQSSHSPNGWASTARRRYWIGTASQLALLILFGVGMAKSTVSGRYLLVMGAIWFVAVLAWNILGPQSFFWSLGKRNRAIAMAASYAAFYLLQLFIFGWLVPLGVGIYRVMTR
jgi:ATP-dependent Clp protease ATP-binding subunit ClpA